MRSLFMRLRQNPQRLRPRRLGAALAALVASGALAVAAPAAAASFPSSPTLDNFAVDGSLNPGWITPALGESGMQLDPVAHEFTSSSGSWAGALWSTPFSSPVEVWAIIHRSGVGGALLYADVAGGTSDVMHPTSGYFVGFGATEPVGSSVRVSIWRIDGMESEKLLTSVNQPFVGLQPGDQIGLSIDKGVIIAWYKPSGGSWTAEVSTFDTRYTGGRIALEAIPGANYGFSQFGGGTPASPVKTATTKTSISASASGATIGKAVTYTAKVTPIPPAPSGTVAFEDGDVVIPNCQAQALNRHGQATCTMTYQAFGTHVVSALYAGSPNGMLAGSTNGPDATVHVTPLLVAGRPQLRVGRRSIIVKLACPGQSLGCSFTPTVALSVHGVAKSIVLKQHSAKLKAGRTVRLVFVLSSQAQATLRSDLRRHRRAVVAAALRISGRDGNRASVPEMFSYTISRASQHTLLSAL
jgi:hypothetical protein